MRNLSFHKQRKEYVNLLMGKLKCNYPDILNNKTFSCEISIALELAFSKGYSCCSKHMVKVIQNADDNV
jgi:hypothetical protein